MQRFLPLVVVMSLLLGISASSAIAAPSAKTEGASLVDTTLATVTGTVTPEGHKTDYAFQWSTSPSFLVVNSTPIKTTESKTPVKESVKIRDIEPATTIYFRLASYDYITKTNYYGEAQSFKTRVAYHPNQFILKENAGGEIKGTNNATNEFRWVGKLGAKTIQCSTVGLYMIPLGSSSSLGWLTPWFEGCGTTTVNPHFCRYVYNLSSVAPPFEGTFGTSCKPSTDTIDFILSGGCTIKIPEQNAGGQLIYTNEPGNVVRAQGVATGVDWTAEPSGACETAGVPTTGTTGEMEMNATFQAYYEGVAGEFFVSDGEELDVGVFLSGGKWQGSEYPTRLGGPNVAATDFSFNGVGADCTGANLVDGVLSGASSSLSVDPISNSCQWAGIFTTAISNSCDYVLNNGGALSVSCSKEGDTIEVRSVGCTAKIGPQSTTGSINYSNLGSGVARSVRAEGSVTGVKYTSSGTECAARGIPASGENGTIGIDSTLSGVYAG